MQTDFKPVHLKQANEKLDEFLAGSKQYQTDQDETLKRSLWQRFLGLFRTSPFELPEELYKGK